MVQLQFSNNFEVFQVSFKPYWYGVYEDYYRTWISLHFYMITKARVYCKNLLYFVSPMCTVIQTESSLTSAIIKIMHIFSDIIHINLLELLHWWKKRTIYLGQAKWRMEVLYFPVMNHCRKWSKDLLLLCNITCKQKTLHNSIY